MHDTQADVISVELDKSRIEGGDKTAMDETEDHTPSSDEDSPVVDDQSRNLIPHQD